MHSEIYDGWELPFFDNAKNFRKYQFKLIKKYLSGNVGEIGPGNGAFLDFYYNLAREISLFEPSINFLPNLKKKNYKNLKILNNFFVEQPNHYDALLYMDVLEHIENDESELSKAYVSLRKDGRLIINVPAFQFLYSNFDRDVNHFRRYSKNSFIKKLNIFKFKKIDMKYYDSIGFFFSLGSKILTKNYKKNFDVKIKIWDRLMMLSEALDFLTFNKIGKSLLIICVK